VWRNDDGLDLTTDTMRKHPMMGANQWPKR
jgi:hypothetical protein